MASVAASYFAATTTALNGTEARSLGILADGYTKARTALSTAAEVDEAKGTAAAP